MRFNTNLSGIHFIVRKVCSSIRGSGDPHSQSHTISDWEAALNLWLPGREVCAAEAYWTQQSGQCILQGAGQVCRRGAGGFLEVQLSMKPA